MKKIALEQWSLRNHLRFEENVLIICDPGKREEAAVFFESAKRYTSNLSCIIFDGMTENAQEPPEEVARAMKSSDIAILTTTHSLSHTQARRAASATGTRIASMPNITLEMMKRTLVADPGTMRENSIKIAALLTSGDKVTLKSAEGSTISLSIHGRVGIADTDSISGGESPRPYCCSRSANTGEAGMTAT